MRSAKFLLATLALIFVFVNAATAQKVQPIDGFYKKIITRNVVDGEIKLVNQTYPMLCFSTRLESNYPKLMRALSDYNTALIQTAKTSRERIADIARERHAAMPEKTFEPFYSASDILIRRADSVAVSVINSFEDYAGGAHGSHGWIGASFDSQTGKRLTISDICTNAERLSQTLIDRLLSEYNDRIFDDPETKIQKLVVEDKINFVLEPRGVMFIFNPYEIAPYAAGMPIVTILFDEQPGLFKEKYRQSPAVFAQSIPMYYSNVIELDGRRIQLNVDPDGIEGDRVAVTLDGRVLVAALKGVQAMSYACTANGGHFLYVDATAEADGFSAVEGKCITIFKLDGEPEVFDRIPYTFQHLIDRESASEDQIWWLMTDPNSIQFDSSQPVGDMYSHIGAINDDGTFSFG